MTSNLTDKKCIPCEAGTPPLDKDRVSELHKETPEWEISDFKRILRHFAFKNFQEALDFVNKVGAVAESEGHHPDMLIYSWNKVKIELWTHAIGGLSENDFIMAAKIDALLK